MPGLFPNLPKLNVRVTVPEQYDIISFIPVDAPLFPTVVKEDPLLNFLNFPPIEEFIPTNWTRKAYTNMFDKFHYADPDESISVNYPDLWKFAEKAFRYEYGYMIGSRLTPVSCTSKNLNSTPAHPLRETYKSESEFISDVGISPYKYLRENGHKLKHLPVLWWTFLKQEILKKDKVVNDDIRMIMCAHPCYARIGCVFEQHQNDLMKTRWATNQGKVGWTPFVGVFDYLMRKFDVCSTVVELDWTRFDGTIPPEVFCFVKDYRKFCLSLDGEDSELYDWYVHNLVYKLTLLPTGEITMIYGGNPSGQISTTTDNIMVNTFLSAFEYAYLYKSVYGVVPSLDVYLKDYRMICYGDDRLCGFSQISFDIDTVVNMYKEVFGMWVKKEKVKVLGTVEDASFCGFTVSKRRNRYVPVPNVRKLYASFSTPVRKLKDICSLWSKLVSIRILVHYVPEAVEFVDVQIERIECLMRRMGVEVPVIPSNFYKLLWEGPE